MAKFAPLVIALIILVAAIGWPRSELTSQSYIQQALNASGQIDLAATKGVWFNQDVPVPIADITVALANIPSPTILGESTDNKWIEIDLSRQRLLAHEGGQVVYDMAVSSGLPWMPTVTGTFYIWAKIHAQRMTGGDVAAGTFYDLPNVPFVQYFYKGYGLHGTYWHNDFGKPRSHGCVNLSIPDAEKLYFWTNPILAANQHSRTNIKPPESTRVIVYGTTPPP